MDVAARRMIDQLVGNSWEQLLEMAKGGWGSSSTPNICNFFSYTVKGIGNKLALLCRLDLVFRNEHSD